METITTGWQKMETIQTPLHKSNQWQQEWCDTCTLKAIGIENAVKKQVDQNKENIMNLYLNVKKTIQIYVEIQEALK